MSSKNLAVPLIRQSRGYALAAAALKEPKAASSVLPNKTFVASLDNGAPITRVTIAFKAGSRYEPPTELGLSHVLRSAAGLSTKCISSFIVARKLAQIGASVTASGDREFVYYTLETSQDNLLNAAEVLKDMVSNQEFRPWELADNLPRLKFDIAALSPQVRAVDLLHKAAFRRTLGNSLFITPKRIDKISSESLQHYACSNIASSRCAVIVVGDSQDKANLIAQSLPLPPGCDSCEASKFYGGELRKETGGDLAHIALAVPGARAGTPQALALAAAAKALGCGPSVKWGSDNSPLAKAIGNIGPFAVAGFNVSYSDNGLFGVVLTVPKDEAAVATRAVAGVLRNATLPSNALQGGRNQLKLSVLSEAEEGTSMAESFAAQGLYTGSVKSPADIAKNIDQLSNNDVAEVLAQAARGPFAMAAVGNLSFVPYVDEL